VRAPDGALLGAISCFQDVTDQKRAEAGAREREQRFRDMFNALPAAVYTTDAEGRITFFNEAAVKMWGRRPELGEMWCGSWRLFWPDGRPMNHDECPMAVTLREDRPVRGATAIAERPDGTRVAFEPYPTPLHDAHGKLVGAINKMLDISEREHAERRQRELIDELNHRVKNTLSTVQSLASQTARTTRSRREFREMFEARLVSLSHAHDQLTRRGWQDADLRAIVSGEIAAHQGTDNRIIVDGGEVRLSPRLALTLAMIVHELATNAAKYGSLSAAEGCVRVSWRVEAREGSRPTLRISWEESGGPPVAPPRRRGFGTLLVERSVAAEHDGRSSLEFAESGLRAAIEIPLDGGR
jgi:PAS domain S-box-containing protein